MWTHRPEGLRKAKCACKKNPNKAHANTHIYIYPCLHPLTAAPPTSTLLRICFHLCCFYLLVMFMSCLVYMVYTYSVLSLATFGHFLVIYVISGASDKQSYDQWKFTLKWNVLHLSAVIRTLVGRDVFISCWSWDQSGLIPVGRDDRRQMSIFIHATQHPSSSDMSGRGALASRVRFNLQKRIVLSQFVPLRRIQRKFHLLFQ